MKGITSEAPVVWGLLKGIICVYKPSDITCFAVRNTIKGNICRDLNQMECRPPMKHVYIEGTKSLTVRVGQNFADNPLVVGPRYQPQDIRCTWASYLGRHTSGVLLLGLNEGTSEAQRLHMSRPTRAYHIKGCLGQATDNVHSEGRVVEKVKFTHVKRMNIDKVVAAMQAAHQKKMFEQSGVDIQSQAAYELASQGPIRPSSNNVPVVYGIKCISFNPPDFTIEVQCINEYEAYLKMLIHEIGLQLHTVATCSKLQCVRQGNFTLEHALLRKHWTVQNLVDNITMSRDMLQQLKHSSARLFKPQKESAMLSAN